MFRTTTRRIAILFLAMALAGAFAYAQQPKAPTLTAAQKQAVVDEISSLLNQNYIFPETAKKVEEALRVRLKNGEFDPPAQSRVSMNPHGFERQGEPPARR